MVELAEAVLVSILVIEPNVLGLDQLLPPDPSAVNTCVLLPVLDGRVVPPIDTLPVPCPDKVKLILVSVPAALIVGEVPVAAAVTIT